MNLITLATLATLTLTDPTSDALGDGTLTPPTSPIYAHSAIFDIQEVAVITAPAAADGSVGGDEAASPEAGGAPLATLAVTMGAVDPDDGSAAGFSGVVIDVYFDALPGGSESTLVGPGMLLPSGGGWEYAVRLSPAGAFAITYEEPPETATSELAGALALPPQTAPARGAGDEAASDLEADPATDPDADPDFGEGGYRGDGHGSGLTVEPLELTIDGNRLVVPLPWPIDEQAVVYAVSGVYDPFSSTSWRPLASSTSPWAYSGGDQVVPVIDVLAVDQAAQLEALATGVLPRPQRTSDRGLVWLLLMAAGVAVAGVGLWLRRQVVGEATTGATTSGLPYGLPPEPIEVEEAVEESADGAVDGAVDGPIDESTDETTDESAAAATDGAVDGAVDGATDGATDGAVDEAAVEVDDEISEDGAVAAVTDPDQEVAAAPERDDVVTAAIDPFDRFGSLDDETEDDDLAHGRFEGERL